MKMHANEELITDVLKGDMGFDGLVISDWQGHPADPRRLPRPGRGCRCYAGIDMFMEPIQAPNNPMAGTSSSRP